MIEKKREVKRWRQAISSVAVICLALVLLLPSAVTAEATNVSIDAPAEVAEGKDFIARVNIDNVTDFDACNYDVTFDATVLEVTDVTAGSINGTTIPVSIWAEITLGTIRVVENVPGLPGVTGSGYLAEIHFHVIGSACNSSTMDLHDGVLGDKYAEEISTTWVDGSVHISTEAMPQANFSASPTKVREGQPITFTDLSTGDISFWSWDLGDGTTIEWALDSRPEDGTLSHTYAEKGAYNISLTVFGASGSDTEIKINYILVSKVIAQQTISPDAAAKVETEDEQIVVDFPLGAVLEETQVTILEEPLPIASTPPSGFKAGNTYFTIEGITTLAKEIAITVKYSDEDVAAAGEDPDLLTLSRYDEDAGGWVVLPTTVDTAAQTLTVTTDQLSRWMVMVEEAPAEAAEEPFRLPWVWVVVVVAGVLVIGVALVQLRRRLTRG